VLLAVTKLQETKKKISASTAVHNDAKAGLPTLQRRLDATELKLADAVVKYEARQLHRANAILSRCRKDVDEVKCELGAMRLSVDGEKKRLDEVIDSTFFSAAEHSIQCAGNALQLNEIWNSASSSSLWLSGLLTVAHGWLALENIAANSNAHELVEALSADLRAIANLEQAVKRVSDDVSSYIDLVANELDSPSHGDE
jgi:hypothetical protein